MFYCFWFDSCLRAYIGQRYYFCRAYERHHWTAVQVYFPFERIWGLQVDIRWGMHLHYREDILSDSSLVVMFNIMVLACICPFFRRDFETFICQWSFQQCARQSSIIRTKLLQSTMWLIFLQTCRYLERFPNWPCSNNLLLLANYSICQQDVDLIGWFQVFPPEDWIVGSSLPCKFNPSTIHMVLDGLSVENVRWVNAAWKRKNLCKISWGVLSLNTECLKKKL